MKLELRDRLIYAPVELCFHGKSLNVSNVIIDTGSAETVFRIGKMLEVGLEPELDDVLERIRGVGDTEWVFTKRLDFLAVGELRRSSFEVQIGAMDYGFELDGIIGLDFLLATGAILNLKQLQLYSA